MTQGKEVPKKENEKQNMFDNLDVEYDYLKKQSKRPETLINFDAFFDIFKRRETVVPTVYLYYILLTGVQQIHRINHPVDTLDKGDPLQYQCKFNLDESQQKTITNILQSLTRELMENNLSSEATVIRTKGNNNDLASDRSPFFHQSIASYYQDFFSCNDNIQTMKIGEEGANEPRCEDIQTFLNSLVC